MYKYIQTEERRMESPSNFFLWQYPEMEEHKKYAYLYDGDVHFWEHIFVEYFLYIIY